MLTALALAAISVPQQTRETMSAMLERVRAKYGLPSVCAGAILNGRIVSLDVVGVRHLGSDARATTDDRYHCGSITKSFTAALFASYVQQGRVDWKTPLKALFPGLAREMDPAFQNLTPLHLMSHRSGLSVASWPKDDAARFWAWNGDRRALRAEYVRAMLGKPPDHAPESTYEYSNANFIILGAALERLTGSTWESMMTTRILRPLGLNSAGFGPAGTDKPNSQPWSHRIENGKLVPVSPGPGADNPPVLGPAGALHKSVPDLLKYCAFQADEGRDNPLLKPETFRVLHSTPFGGEYGLGLGVTQRSWADGLTLTHNGSNTMNYEVMWISPAKRFAVVVATNAAPEGVGNGLDEICATLIGRYCSK